MINLRLTEKDCSFCAFETYIKTVLTKMGTHGLFSEMVQDLEQEGMNSSLEETRHERHLGNNVFANKK